MNTNEIDKALLQALAQKNIYKLAADKKIAKGVVSGWRHRIEGMKLDKKLEILQIAGWSIDIVLTQPTTTP